MLKAVPGHVTAVNSNAHIAEVCGQSQLVLSELCEAAMRIPDTVAHARERAFGMYIRWRGYEMSGDHDGAVIAECVGI